jgi:hypothetical protein
MEVYRKQGKKYVAMGHEFTGFPGDGIWLVQNGTKNMMCLIGLKENVPHRALEYRIHADALSSHLVETFKDKAHSWNDVAVACADFFAEKSILGENEK